MSQRSCSVKKTKCSHTIFTRLSSVNSCSKCFTLNSCTFFNFSYIRNKEASSYRQNIVMFRHNIAYMVNSFLVPLEIPIMINILYKMIKILHEEMLNTKCWY